MNRGYYILKEGHCHLFEEVFYFSSRDEGSMYCRTYYNGNLEDEDGNKTLHTGWIELESTTEFESEEWMNEAYDYFEDIPQNIVDAGHNRQEDFFGTIRDYE